MSIVKVIRAGLSTSIQDLGRPGLRHFGIPVGGAMDRLSCELANRLIGNVPEAAALEMTLSGDELEWTDDSLIAITGADLTPVVSGGLEAGRAVPQHTPVLIRGGTRISFQTARRGCRCYLAIAGGFDAPLIMGSRATYLRARVGGFNGRTLQRGDELPVGQPGRDVNTFTESLGLGLRDQSALSAPSWFVRPLDLPSQLTVMLRVLRGTHFDFKFSAIFLRKPLRLILYHDVLHDGAHQFFCQWSRRLIQMCGGNFDLRRVATRQCFAHFLRGKFNRFVKPSLHPNLSPFCRQLTTIEQPDVNRAKYFPDVIQEFQDWARIEEEDYVLCSWGNFDRKMFAADCRLHRLDDAWTEHHATLKEQYRIMKRMKSGIGLRKAVEKEDIVFTGQHHRGISDAENLVKLFLKYLGNWNV